jgi:L-lactate dehydrogenase (cytochrome)
VFAYIKRRADKVERNYTLRANAAAFEWRYEFVPRMLVDTSKRSARQTHAVRQALVGALRHRAHGHQRLSAYRGDLVLAQAAAQENVPMIMSGSSLIRLEEVVQANPQAWFQAYLPGDEPSIDRADRAREGGGLPDAGGDGGRLHRLQPREQHPRRLLHAAAAQPLAWPGRA